jgi:hypothetical protein
MLKDKKLSIIGLTSMEASLPVLLKRFCFFESFPFPRFILATFVRQVVDAESIAINPFYQGFTPSSFL